MNDGLALYGARRQREAAESAGQLYTDVTRGDLGG